MKSLNRRPVSVPRPLSQAPRHATKSFKGTGSEIVLVGRHGSEISAVGTARQKFDLMYHGKLGPLSFMGLGTRMGFLTVKPTGEILVTKEVGPDGRLKDITPVEAGRLDDGAALAGIRTIWDPYVNAHTGIRTLTEDNIGWDPRFFIDGRSKVLETDFGAPLPTGWNWNALGIPGKDVSGFNDAILMVHETGLGALLDAAIHPRIRRIEDTLDLKWTGSILGTGIGALDALEEMMSKSKRVVALVNFLANINAIKPEKKDSFMAMFTDLADKDEAVVKEALRSLMQAFDDAVAKVRKDEKRVGAKDLADLLANVAGSHLARRLGFSGMLSTHVGACESSMGAIADAANAIQRGRLKFAFAGGFESAMTPSSFYGFNAAGALMTNVELVEVVRLMVAEGAVEAKLLDELPQSSVFGLSPSITKLASMPFSRWRRGFVMGKGAGMGLFTTLQEAIDRRLPIAAIVAGAGDKFMDSPESIREGTRLKSIADMGDGPQRAFLYSVQEAAARYSDFHIDRVGALIGHGTSTPTNGLMERRNFHTALVELGRREGHPLLITGDKGLQGHRIGGNYAALAMMVLRTGQVPPVTNYNQRGHEPIGPTAKPASLGRTLDEMFPFTAVVGKDGVGQGKPVKLPGDHVYINAAGFGHINSGVLLRGWSADRHDWKPDERKAYEGDMRDLNAKSAAARHQIDLGLATYLGE